MKTVALLGNPNSGKTTLFNGLTGSNQKIGNWPGVTVDKKEGKLKFNNEEYNIVDLPGTYSLGAYSEDEIVARDFLLNGNPDVVISVIDATNLERNLYLLTQLMETGSNVIIALNMMDEAEKKLMKIDVKKLSDSLGIPVIPMVASKETGLDKLKEQIEKSSKSNSKPNSLNMYSEDLQKEINDLTEKLSNLDTNYPSEWLAIKALEGDKKVLDILSFEKNLSRETYKHIVELSETYELGMIDSRYDFIRSIVNSSVKKPDEAVVTLTDKVDKIITNKYLGIPIFAAIMFVIFQLTFKIGEELLGDTTGEFIGYLGEKVAGLLGNLNAPEWLMALVQEGFFEGVGTVLAFVPIIMVLYFFLGLLEDSGYMARAAYVMDGVMRSIGLHGKTFIPMIIGFGCTVPAVMATRTLDNKKDRMIAILINPFMSCGAKVPIYLAFTAAFFPKNGGVVMFALYAIGIIVALIMGKIFSSTIFKGEESHFIMELPPYRAPILKYVIRDMWDKVSSFIKRAGTTIFSVIVILWILAHLPGDVEAYSQESILGMIGTFIAPIFKPAGFGTWQAAVSLFAGIPAKEVVVATLGMVYAGVNEGSELVGALQQHFTPLTALSFLIMTLLYTPCAAALGAIKQETGSVKWMLFVAVYTFVIGLVAATLVFQIGTLLGF